MTTQRFSTEELQKTLLSALDASGSIPDTRELELTGGAKAGSDADVQALIKGALDSLAGREMVDYSINSTEIWALTPEGQQVVDSGSPEFRVWLACGEAGGLSMKDLQVRLAGLRSTRNLTQLQSKLGADVVKVGQLNAFKRKWISKQGDTFAQNVSFFSASLPDVTDRQLK